MNLNHLKKVRDSCPKISWNRLLFNLQKVFRIEIKMTEAIQIKFHIKILMLMRCQCKIPFRALQLVKMTLSSQPN